MFGVEDRKGTKYKFAWLPVVTVYGKIVFFDNYHVTSTGLIYNKTEWDWMKPNVAKKRFEKARGIQTK